MTFQPGANLYTTFGLRPENIEVPVIQTRSPSSTDTKYPIGKQWVDKTNDAVYQLTSLSNASGVLASTWTQLSNAGGAGSFTSVTATNGDITATDGDLVLGTTGNKLLIDASSSATSSVGSFTLAGAATTVVSNSAVTANSLIFLQTGALGTVTEASTLAVTAISAGVSFTVTPSESTDTSTVNFLIIN